MITTKVQTSLLFMMIETHIIELYTQRAISNALEDAPTIYSLLYAIYTENIHSYAKCFMRFIMTYHKLYIHIIHGYASMFASINIKENKKKCIALIHVNRPR